MSRNDNQYVKEAEEGQTRNSDGLSYVKVNASSLQTSFTVCEAFDHKSTW